MRVVVAPETPDDIKGIPVFLAGPIQGTWDWQSEAIRLLNSWTSESSRPFIIFNPRRPVPFTDELEFATQVDWETKAIEIAAEYGVVMFWLARETENVPGRAYAQTSRFELGERFALADFGGLVVGIESGFSGEQYIRHRCKNRPEVSIPLCSTLEATCRTALGNMLEMCQEETP